MASLQVFPSLVGNSNSGLIKPVTAQNLHFSVVGETVGGMWNVVGPSVTVTGFMSLLLSDQMGFAVVTSASGRAFLGRRVGRRRLGLRVGRRDDDSCGRIVVSMSFTGVATTVEEGGGTDMVVVVVVGNSVSLMGDTAGAMERRIAVGVGVGTVSVGDGVGSSVVDIVGVSVTTGGELSAVGDIVISGTTTTTGGSLVVVVGDDVGGGDSSSSCSSSLVVDDDGANVIPAVVGAIVVGDDDEEEEDVVGTPEDGGGDGDGE